MAMQRGRLLLNGVVVGAIVLILVAMILAAPSGPRSSPERMTTKMTLKGLATILGEYRAQTGSVPKDVSTLIAAATAMPSSEKLIHALPSGAVAKGMRGDTAVLDGFGNRIVLINDATKPRSPYFQSAGPDGVLGNADDMFSYDP
jgi:hypothetical protein